MIEQIAKFFEEHPEATEVHVALGYLHETSEEAFERLRGTSEVAKVYTREQVEAKETEKPVDINENPLIQSFKKVAIEKMPTLIEQQAEVVAKMTAGLMAADDKEKAERALNFHSSILEAMKAAFKEKSGK